MRVKAVKGGASGGTVASMMNIMEEVAARPALRADAGQPVRPRPRAAMREGPTQPNVTAAPSTTTVSGEWVAPFVMAGDNTRVVHRTHALLGQPWGDDFLYDEAMMIGDGARRRGQGRRRWRRTGGTWPPLAPSARCASCWAGAARARRGSGPRGPGEGLLRHAVLRGRPHRRRTIITKVTGDRDPGYGSTAKMLGEARSRCSMSRSDVDGGFWTPATAMGDELDRRLVEHAG